MGFGDSWAIFLRRMPWFLQYYMLLLPLAMSMVSVVDSGRKLPPIYWNSTNSIFNHGSRDNEIDINIGDSIDIICPQYPIGTSVTDMEYYVIYMVNKTQYETCVINNTSVFKVLVNCSYPTLDPGVMYTLLIKKFQSIPGNPDFEPGEKYYFITTSGGTIHSLDNQYKGQCDHHDRKMKIMLNVCCNASSSTPKPKPSYETPITPSETTAKPVVTTQHTTTTRTTTTTTATTTTTMKKTTPGTRKPTYTDRIPGKDKFPGDNVINANGPKNVGYISDSSGHRTSLSVAILLVSLIFAHWFR